MADDTAGRIELLRALEESAKLCDEAAALMREVENDADAFIAEALAKAIFDAESADANAGNIVRICDYQMEPSGAMNGPAKIIDFEKARKCRLSNPLL